MDNFNNQDGNNMNNGNQSYTNGQPYNQNQYNQNQYNQNQYNQNQYMNNGNGLDEPRFTKYLVFSIIETLTCNQLFGILAIVYTVLGNKAYKNGLYDESQKKFKTAKTMLLIGLILIIVCCVIYAGIMGIGLLTGIANVEYY